jgi:hypothetical protein
MIPWQTSWDLVLDTGVGGQRVLCVQLRLVGLLTLVVLGNLLVNFVLTQACCLLASDLS